MFTGVDEAAVLEKVPNVLDCIIVFWIRGPDEVVEGDVALDC